MFEKLKGIIVDTINCSEDEVTLEANLRDDLNMDSLDAMEVNMAIEEAFEVTISDEDVAKFATVKDIVDFLEGNN